MRVIYVARFLSSGPSSLSYCKIALRQHSGSLMKIILVKSKRQKDRFRFCLIFLGNNPAFLEFNLDTLFGFRAVDPTHDVCKAFGKGGSDADIGGAVSRLEHGRDDPPSGVGIFKMFQSDATASKTDRGESSSADDVFKMFGSKGNDDADIARPQNSDIFKMFDIGGARSDSVEKGSADFFSDFGRKSSAGGSQTKGRFTLF